MFGLLRAIVFVGCLGAGTWMSLGRPPFAQCTQVGQWLPVLETARVATEKAIRSAMRVASRTIEHNNSDHRSGLGDLGGRKNRDAANHEPTSAPTAPADFSHAPALRPWPALNPEQRMRTAWRIAEGPALREGSGRRLVTLTFDDGFAADSATRVLQLLADNNVHATFFAVGQDLEGDSPRAKASRQALRLAYEAGHFVGNAGFEHRALASLPRAQLIASIDRAGDAIERIIAKRPIIFRPPFGKLSDVGEQALRDQGLELVLWNIELHSTKHADARAAAHDLTSQLEQGHSGIIALGKHRDMSADTVEELLRWLRDHRWDPVHPSRIGYEVVDLPTFLRAVADSPLVVAPAGERKRRRSVRSEETLAQD